MLRGRHVAEEGRAVRRRDRAAYRRGDVVVAGRYVGDDGAEHVEGRAVAERLFYFHVRRYLVERHVAGAFYHNLHVARPRALRQLAERDELAYLRRVGRVGDAARAAGVAEAQRHVVLAADFKNFVEALEEGIFLPRHLHPREHYRAAARNDVREALVALELRRVVAVEAAVYRHEVDAVLRVHAHDVYPLVRRYLRERLVVVDDRVVYRHRADHRGTVLREVAAEFARVAEGAEVHYRLRAHVDGAPDLRELHLHVRHVARGAEVHVYLRLERRADRARRYALVQLVARDYRAPLRHLAHELRGRDSLLRRGGLHLFRDYGISRRLHLRCVSHSVHSLSQKISGERLHGRSPPKDCLSQIFLRRHYPRQVQGSKLRASSQPVVRAPPLA